MDYNLFPINQGKMLETIKTIFNDYDNNKLDDEYLIYTINHFNDYSNKLNIPFTEKVETDLINGIDGDFIVKDSYNVINSVEKILGKGITNRINYLLSK